MTKICTHCKIEKEEKEFNKHSRRPDHLQCWCRKCATESRRAHYYSNLLEMRRHKNEYQKKYRVTHLEKLREHDRQSYQRNREAQLESARIYRTKNRSLINKKQIIKARENGIPPRSGYVYIAHFPHEMEGKNYYKIGQSKSPKSRMIRISSHAPIPVEIKVLIFTKDMSMLESELHHKFQEKRSNYEWYILEENDLNDILLNYSCLVPPFD